MPAATIPPTPESVELSPAAINKQIAEDAAFVRAAKLGAKWVGGVLASLAVIFICYITAQTWSFVKNTSDKVAEIERRVAEIDRRQTAFEKVIEEMKAVPARVEYLERHTREIDTAQSESSRNQAAILAQLAGMDGYIKGLQSGKEKSSSK